MAQNTHTHEVTDKNTKINENIGAKGEYENKISLRGRLAFKTHNMFITQLVYL